MKKVFSLFFSIIFIMASFIPLSTYAGIRTSVCSADILDSGLSEQSNFNLESVIYDGLINCSEYIDISSYGISVNDINKLTNDYYTIIHNNPDLFYVSTGFAYLRNSLTNNIMFIQPQYTMKQDEIPAAKKIFEEGIEKAVRLVDDTMTDVQKALVIHDYICDKASYPKLNYNNGQVTNDDPLYHSAYGFFKNNIVVCEGYTNAYTAILQRLGIESKYVSSNAMSHSWNIIKIDGKWYNVDLTFDDPVLDQNNYSSTYGIFTHTYFLKSDKYFTSIAENKHTGYAHSEGISCNDTSFDNYFWNDSIGYIGVHEGNYYYLDYNNKASQSLIDINVVKRDIKGNAETVNTKAYKSLLFKFGSTKRTNAQIVPYGGKLYLSHFYVDSKAIYHNEIDIINYDKSYYTFDILPSNINYVYAMGIIDGNLGYLSALDLQKNSFSYHTYSRNERFQDLYKENLYDPYVDINNDGIINSKDYTYIMHNEFKF